MYITSSQLLCPYSGGYIKSNNTVLLIGIQGITDFLPISSFSHFSLASFVAGSKVRWVIFDLAAHASTLHAVLLCFRHEVAALTRNGLLFLKHLRFEEQGKLSFYIVTLALLFMAYGFRRIGRISRLEGAGLLIAFCSYNTWLVLSVAG
ncbi:undecaprenyl-diphosphate phosphatase [Arsukibacterium perlucidum]|uniref:undecaprenyl-diphosphate phosphatase n=1 Tax=Arsukibacterium perlucidum TaxID=368811 RepID=UPI0003621CEF|nr:undecaprenyl-diphosphate phosphatase [Arsukibacterium perlucidum]